jgi:hypothetical protein
MRISENIHTSFGYSDALSKSRVWAAYANHFAGEEIMDEGFNINSGNVYIALENGVTIASAFGRFVEFYVYDFDNDEEFAFESIEELNQHLGTRY